jgi:hypothetical protein
MTRPEEQEERDHFFECGRDLIDVTTMAGPRSPRVLHELYHGEVFLVEVRHGDWREMIAGAAWCKIDNQDVTREEFQRRYAEAKERKRVRDEQAA